VAFLFFEAYFFGFYEAFDSLVWLIIGGYNPKTLAVCGITVSLKLSLFFYSAYVVHSSIMDSFIYSSFIGISSSNLSAFFFLSSLYLSLFNFSSYDKISPTRSYGFATSFPG